MISVECYSSIFCLKKEWKEFENKGIDVYQHYYIQKQIFLRMPLYYIRRHYKPRYFMVREDKKPVLIAPLCKYNGIKKYVIIGLFSGFQSYDFIYDTNTTVGNIKKYVQAILNYIGDCEIEIKFMSNKSLAYQALKSMNSIENFEHYPNVSIAFDRTYADYYAKLSKHTRQNIRTAYNRLQRDNQKIQIELIERNKVKNNVLNQIIDIYCRRYEERYKIYISRIRKFYIRYFDFSTWYQQYYVNNYCAILYINNKIAAFMTGVIDDKNQSAIIPRLAIDREYEKYSPGLIMINEIAKKYSEGKGQRILDLSKGAESYKLAMGGIEYPTYNFTVLNRK